MRFLHTAVLLMLLWQPNLRQHGSLAVSWTGRADTTLQFSEFNSNDYSILVRFMPQFPNAYYGPIVAENGSGRFVIGQGDYLAGTNGRKLYVAVGSQSQSYSADLTAGQWHHLALVGDRNGATTTWRLYLDGSALSPTFTTNNSDGQLPAGVLRLGKRTNGATLANQNAQFYGLIDDVAVFSKALTASEIQTYRANGYVFSGSESGLVAAYTFGPASHPKLTRPVSPAGAAKIVPTSSNHNASADKQKLPLPTAHKVMFLPTPPGEAWKVIQGVDRAGGSHKGYASFCWDLIVDGHSQGGEYPDGTKGAPFYAAGSGKVVNVDQGRASGQSPSNILEIQQGPEEFVGYLHLKKDSSEVSVNKHVTRGDKLALAWDSGASLGAHHLHIATHDKQDGVTGFVTFPIAFSDYEVRQPNGSWKFVERGMPADGDVIRRPLPQDLPYRLTAVWRKSNSPEIQVYGWTYDDYRKKYDDLWPNGWRLKLIRPHVRDGQVRYTAAWEKGGGGEIQVYGWTYDDYRKKYDELWPKGWRLKHLEPYVVSGKVRYTAVWRPSTEGEIQVYGWTYQDYRKKYDELWEKGWRLKLLKPYVVNGQVRYTAVWKPGGEAEIQVYGWKYQDYRAKYDELWPKGWRLKLLETYGSGDDRRYTAAWVKSTAAELQLYGAKYQHYRITYDEIWPDEWRLAMLDVD